MPAPLVPCVHCERHVRSTETECPFCHGAIELRAARVALRGPEQRLGSLAVMTFRAIALGAALTACGASDDDDDKGAAGRRASGGGGSASHPDDLAGNSGGGRAGAPLGGATFGGSPADGGQVAIYRATPKG